MENKKISGKIFYIVSSIIIVFLVLCDQISKALVLKYLKPIENINVISFGKKKIIDFTFLENSGAVFGKFAGKRIMIIIVPLILIALCVVFIERFRKKSKLASASLILIIAGGIGNLIDRIFRNGLVVDFIEFKFVNFAVFNFADTCVTCGVALLLIYVIFFDQSFKDSNKENENTKNKLKS